MKNTAFTVFRTAIIIVLVAKILNWFLNFNDETNQIINTVMFCLIGFAYAVVGFYWDNNLKKVIIITCGLYLIIMNFIPTHTIFTAIGIVCILIPMLIARFDKGDLK